MPDSDYMNEERVIEKIGELRIKLAMLYYAEHEGRELQKENAALKGDPFYQPTAEAVRKFKKTLNTHYHIKKIKNFIVNSTRPLSRSAIIFSLLLSFFSLTSLTVKAVQVEVLNFFIGMQDQYTQLRLTPDKGNFVGNNIFINWDNAYAPAQIPDKFAIQRLTNHKDLKAIEYKNPEGEIMIFQQHNENSSMNIDTENANVIERITIHGQNGLLIEKGNLVTVVWKEDSHMFSIDVQTNTLSHADVLEIAESVKLIK